MSFKFHRLFKYFFILFFAFSHFASAQDVPPSIEEEKPQERPSDQKIDLFDPMEAPITYKGAFIKMMLTLLALLALIVISVWMLKRISHGRMKQLNYGRNIKILERRPLSAKSILYLVEIAGKKVVISESQLEVRRISSADNIISEEE